jgi:site-specific DNA recombinase
MKMAAIYARVSSEQQREENTIASQTALLIEFARHGIETVFVKSPQGDSAEDQLLVQFQGMIAECERAQILERSRRGKRYRAQLGEVSVMSNAPYGYR